MLADHAARITPRSACFGTKTWRECCNAHGQLTLIKNAFAHQIGQRDFGCRDQPIIIPCPELVIAEFRQLRRTNHRLIFDQKRRIDFGIAMRAGMQVEHELPQSPFKPCQRPFIDDKT